MLNVKGLPTHTGGILAQWIELFYTIHYQCSIGHGETVQTFQLFKDLSDGQGNILLLMAVPFLFLGVVIAAFIIWLKHSREPNDSHQESE